MKAASGDEQPRDPLTFPTISRPPSRSATPVPVKSPSRLLVPPHALRPTHSLSNLHIPSRGSPSPALIASTTTATNAAGQVTTPPPSNQELDSSASSISDVEGILVQDVDAEVDTIDGEEGNTEGYIQPIDGIKTDLREQLRRTLTKRQSNAGKWLLNALFNKPR